MDILGHILEGVSALLGVWLMVMLIYQLYLTAFGFRRDTGRDYQPHEPQARFLVLVPAHNEAEVIGDIVDNLQQMDYPREMYDFYIIADNCTDDTAERARSLGAGVIETCRESPQAPTGKPIALKKALESLGDYQNRYDLLMIFDADNLMDRHLFREVNSQYIDKGRPDFIQCYLGAKNKQGVVAWFYYTSYTITNRFFQLAKHRRGLNCSIGGTGFAMSTQYLHDRGGWTTMSLTEDFEIQVEATLDGRRILWNHNARIYDEKPTSLKASIRQKLRWGQGHWFVCLRNTGKVFRSLAQRKIGVREFISVLTYMYSLSAYVVAALQLIIGLALHFLPYEQQTSAGGLGGIVTGLVLFCYSYFALFYIADWIDNRIPFRLSTVPLMIVSFFANIIVGVINQVAGLLLCRRQQHWVKTEHKLHRPGKDQHAVHS
ncbi:MAG: glycosyltransferase family 2 protein [Clostridia bacterium]|nr:glycosyltransferase family 2 protein [Clostridia bacterium]